MKRTKAYYRHHRWRVINRKKKFVKQTGRWNYKFDGVFNKGKMHCSCGMCTYKIRTLGYTMSDMRKIERLKSMEKELVS